jgi:hypothetical protein
MRAFFTASAETLMQTLSAALEQFLICFSPLATTQSGEQGLHAVEPSLSARVDGPQNVHIELPFDDDTDPRGQRAQDEYPTVELVYFPAWH